jgi:endonuclease/exonuclease/phosphatase (EEP) superfamily protein YafD
MCATPVAAATLWAVAARAGYPFEMAVHFRPQYLVISATVGLAALPFRAWRVASLAGLTAAWNLGAMAMVPPGAPALAAKDRGDIVVVWGNVHNDPAAALALAEIALAVDADAVLAAETSDLERVVIEQGLENYSCRSAPPAGQWGVVAFARGDCLAFAAVKAPGDARYRDYWQARVKVKGAHLWGAHVYTPLSAISEKLRNRQIMWAQPAAPGLVVGDFNASPWSPPILDLQKTGLKRVDCGGPFRHTFPVGARALGVAIDHGFVTAGLAARCEVGASTGSDHYPLILYLRARP